MIRNPLLPILIFVLHLAGTALSSAQETGLSSSERRGKVRAVVYQGDRGDTVGISGWILEQNDSSLLLDTGRELTRVSQTSISHVDILTRINDDLPAALFAGGAFLATHLMVMRDNASRTDLYRSGSSTYARLPFTDMVVVGAGGGMLGGLIGATIVAEGRKNGGGEGRHRIVIDNGRNREGWEELGSHMKSASRPLSLQVTTAGLVAFGSDEVVLGRHESAGSAFEEIEGGGSLPHQWFRRMRVGYSLSPTFDLGLTLANPSLPRRRSRFVIPHFPADLLRTDIETVVQGIGLAPSARLRPSGQSGGLEFGVAAGLASVGFYERTTSPAEVTREIVVDSIEERSILPLALLNVDYSFYVTDGLAVGLTTDLMFLPALTPPPRRVGKESDPEAIPLTSISAGVSVGYRW